MASWFTKLVDKATPWDRGGEVQRRQEEEERRRREAEARAQTRNQSRQNNNNSQVPGTIIQPFSPTPQPQPLADDRGPKTPTPQEKEQKRKTVENAYRSIKDTGSAGPYAPEILEKADDRVRSERYAQQSVVDRIKNIEKAKIAGSARFGFGTAQALGGLYDILTPGKGTNRLSDWATDKAEQTDAYVERNDLPLKQYRGTQVASELLGGVGAGALGKQAVKRGPQILQKGVTKLDDIIGLIPGKGKGGDIARRTATELVDPSNVASELYFANKPIAEDVAKGTEITPERVALEYGMALPGAAGSAILGRGISSLSRNADNVVTGADVITQAPNKPNQVEIAPGVKVDAPAPQPTPQVEIGGVRWNEPTVGQAVDNPAEVAPALLDADARLLSNPVPAQDPLDIPAYQRRDAEADILRNIEAINELNARSEALRKAVAPDTNPTRVAEFERRRAGQTYNPAKVEAMDALADRKVAVTEENLVKTVGEQAIAEKELDQAIKARSAQEALQEGGPVIEKPAPVAQAEARAAEAPAIVPVDDAGKVVDAVETPPVRPDMPGEGAVVTMEAPTVKAADPDVNTGVAKTGEVGKSKARSAKGREYEKTSREADLARGASEAAKIDYETFVNDTTKSGTPNLRDRSIAENMQDRFNRTDPEWRRLSTIRGEVDTELGQGLATTARTIRKKADAKQLTDRFANKLYNVMDDDQVVTKGVFDSVDEKTKAFVKARDEVGRAQDEFLADPSDANFKKFMKAFDEADQADSAAKFEEYKIASEFLEKSKNEKAIKYLDGLKRDAGVYAMDAVDSAMLSGTRTMLNNFLNTLGIAGEEMGFGKLGAKVAGRFKFAKDLNIGGGSIKGWRLGKKIGNTNLKKDISLRSQARGNKLVNAYKNVITTGNTLGERNISGAIYAGAYDHYRQVLKKAGFKGPELDRRAMVQALTDPDEVIDSYRTQVLNANALGGTTSSFRTKFEQQVAHTLSMGSKNKAVQGGAKLITRATLGFPTVVWRSTVQGAKRTLLGAPSWVQARNAFKAGKPDVAAMHIKNAIKEGGSGAAMGLTGAYLASEGLLTGAYPSDEDEQARWERDGITENSIKIGSDYHQLPPILGSLALPFMVGANTQQELANGDSTNAVEKATKIAMGALQTAINSSPVDSFDKTVKFWTDLEAGKDVSKYLAQTGSSMVRGLTPAGAFINQVAKMFDPTKNDTQQGDAIAQFISKVQDGFPGWSNMLPAKEVNGNEIRNPSAISRLFGASSTEQSGGVQKTADIQKRVDDSVKSLSDYGAFSDNVRNLLEDDKKVLLDKAKNGKKLDESDIKDLMDSMTKGVSATEDNQFLEKEQYDDNLAVLKVKRDMLANVPTTTKATLDEYDTQIKRGEIYKKNKTPYTLVKDYKDYGLEDWRALGIPPGDKNHDPEAYDPELYKALWQLDQEMTEAGVSRGKKGKAKYYQKDKTSGSGRGGSGNSTRSSNFTQLSSGLLGGSGTKENKYTAIDKPKSYIPDLQSENKAKTSLKKSITVKKGVQYT